MVGAEYIFWGLMVVIFIALGAGIGYVKYKNGDRDGNR